MSTKLELVKSQEANQRTIKETELENLRKMCEGLLDDDGNEEENPYDVRQGSITLDELGFVLHPMVTRQRQRCFEAGLHKVVVDEIIDDYKTAAKFDVEVERKAA